MATPDFAVLVAHFARDPAHRTLLEETLASIRAQRYAGRVEIAVADDGSAWSAPLLRNGEDLRILAGEDLRAAKLLADLPVDAYVVGRRAAASRKAVLLNRAIEASVAPRILVLDDDHALDAPDTLARLHRDLDRYAFVMGRLQNPDGSFRLFHDPRVQGTTFAIRRDTLDAVGRFGEHTAAWGTGDDPDFFWRLWRALAPEAQAPKQALFAGDIITRDRCSGRWRPTALPEAEFRAAFHDRYGVDPMDNPSRNKAAWMDHGARFPALAEAKYRVINALRRRKLL